MPRFVERPDTCITRRIHFSLHVPQDLRLAHTRRIDFDRQLLTVDRDAAVARLENIHMANSTERRRSAENRRESSRQASVPKTSKNLAVVREHPSIKKHQVKLRLGGDLVDKMEEDEDEDEDEDKYLTEEDNNGDDLTERDEDKDDEDEAKDDEDEASDLGRSGSNAGNLIPKPPGESGRPGSGGYNLEKALTGWSEGQYQRIKSWVRKEAARKLDETQSFVGQDQGEVTKICQNAIDRFPILRKYEEDWPVLDMLKVRLKYTSGQNRKKVPEPAQKTDRNKKHRNTNRK